ncbi:MAG TPA: hypothetical protein VK052_12245 [Zeimonas sp.]|nr:hypothetical protein [Zeimonas sp.]
MCAIVPFMPVVVTEPLIVRSAATEIVPVPVAEVFAGGTSAAPLSMSFICCADAPATKTSAAAATAAGHSDLRRFAIVIMASTSLVRG